MTKQEIIDKYGSTEVEFYYYYKYMFHYSGWTHDGYKVVASYGGDADSIYRTEVYSNDKRILKESEWMWDSISVYDGGGEPIAEWSNF